MRALGVQISVCSYRINERLTELLKAIPTPYEISEIGAEITLKMCVTPFRYCRRQLHRMCIHPIRPIRQWIDINKKPVVSDKRTQRDQRMLRATKTSFVLLEVGNSQETRTPDHEICHDVDIQNNLA